MTGDVRGEYEAAVDDAMDEVVKAVAYAGQREQGAGLQWSEDVKEKLVLLASSK